MSGPGVCPFTYRRHSRVWLKTGDADLAHIEKFPHGELLAQHAKNKHPFVARRRNCRDSANGIPLGLLLPRGSEPRMITFCVDQPAVFLAMPPLLLSEVLEKSNGVPFQWVDELRHLHAQLFASGIDARVYGSFAWQFSTEKHYITENSDIDLSCQPKTLEQANECLRLLGTWSGQLRIDGEIEFQDGEAVAWRELLSDTKTVLVKNEHTVRLADRDSLWKTTTWQLS